MTACSRVGKTIIKDQEAVLRIRQLLGNPKSLSLYSTMSFCYGCAEPIADQYIIRVAPNLQWHSACLRCSVCDRNLSDGPSCFMKNGKPYCKNDYEREFSVKCHGCKNIIDRSSLVMVANNLFYHVNCFKCNHCNETLVSGDQYSISPNGQLFCHSDSCIQDRSSLSDDGWSDANSNTSISTYKESANSVDLESSPLSSNPEKEAKPECISIEGKTKSTTSTKKNSKDKPTRVRTVLNEKQLSTLKRCYAANPRPDSVLKEQLVDLTGLSPRVIRVWFQNKRCKDKKKMMLNGGDGKIGDILHSRLPMHSSPLNEEINLPGCSPPVHSTVHSLQNSTLSTHASTYVPNSNQDPRLLVTRQEYREAASYQNYGVWNKYGSYDYSYQDNSMQNSQYQQLVS